MSIETEKIRGLLSRWGHAWNIIREKRQMLDAIIIECETTLCTLHSPIISDMPRGNQTSDCVMMAIVEYDETIERLKETRNNAMSIIAEELRFWASMDRLISELPEIQQKILHMRYEHDKPWKCVVNETKYSESQARFFECEAIKMIREHIDCPNEKSPAFSGVIL